MIRWNFILIFAKILIIQLITQKIDKHEFKDNGNFMLHITTIIL